MSIKGETLPMTVCTNEDAKRLIDAGFSIECWSNVTPPCTGAVERLIEQGKEAVFITDLRGNGPASFLALSRKGGA